VVELLTGTLCFCLLMGMSYAFARSALTSARVQEAMSDAQEVTLMAVDLWTREVRMAGFSATGAPIDGVRVASQERVEVAADFNGDGNTDDPNELIAYGYNESKGELVRATGGASPQPLVRNVPSGGLEFRFFDAAGTEMRAGSGLLSADERRRIRRVDMRLRVALPVEPVGGRAVVSTVSGSACLRNQ
jgi:Tfp pilus assembly protein PilW